VHGLTGREPVGLAGSPADREHRGAFFLRDRASLRGGVADEDERPGRSIDALSVDVERRCPGDDEVELFLA
jgi:hypothetical protein